MVVLDECLAVSFVEAGDRLSDQNHAEPGQPQEVELSPLQGLTRTDKRLAVVLDLVHQDLLLLLVLQCLLLAPRQQLRVDVGLRDEETGEQLYGEIQSSQYQHQSGNSLQQFRVSEILSVCGDVLRVQDGCLDLVEDKSSATEASDHNAHGGALVVREPPHADGHGWYESDALPEGGYEAVGGGDPDQAAVEGEVGGGGPDTEDGAAQQHGGPGPGQPADVAGQRHDDPLGHPPH